MQVHTYIFLAALMVAALPCSTTFAQRGFPLNAAPRVYAYGMEPSYHGSVDLADYDGDGDLDVLVTGRSGSAFFTKVYCQSRIITSYTIGEFAYYDTVRTFLEPTTNITDVWQSSARWADYDGDGDADVLVSGRTSLSGADGVAPITRLFESRGNQYFEDERSDFLDVFAGDIAWGDVDADGDLDVVVTGMTGTAASSRPATRLYRNDGGIFSMVPTNLPDVAFGGVAWSDVDDDGDLDLALQGVAEGGLLVTDVYRNDGNGDFNGLMLDVPRLSHGSFDWGDLDNDGDDDLLVTGGHLDPHLQRGLTAIYENEDGRFRRISVQLSGVLMGAGKFADFDLDGRLDIVISGAPTVLAQPTLAIYLNNGSGFDAALSPSGLMLGDLAVGDYNDDGDPDVVVIGASGDMHASIHFFQNHIRPDRNKEDLMGSVIADPFGNWSGCVQRQ